MTVGELKELLANVPDHLPVIVGGYPGEDNLSPRVVTQEKAFGRYLAGRDPIELCLCLDGGHP